MRTFRAIIKVLKCFVKNIIESKLGIEWKINLKVESYSI